VRVLIARLKHLSYHATETSGSAGNGYLHHDVW
jgi:hypothetical protein